jgi:twinkle protein
LLFDQDEPGIAAAAECAALFPPGKCAIGVTPRKDANETLNEDGVKVLCQSVYNAKPFRPDGIVSLGEIRDRVLMTPETGRPWFLPGLTKASFGRRLGDVIGLGAATGCGKTDFLAQQVVFDVMQLQIPVGAIFLEQGVGETGKRMAGKMAGKRFHVPDGTWTQAELDATWSQLEATNRLHLYDAWGATDWDTIGGKIRYMVSSLGCQHIYLDHLTAMAAAEDDERKALERIMSEAAGMAKSLNFILHYVSHLATPEGKSHEEGGRVKARDFKGARAIAFWSHFMFGLERDTQSPGTPTTLRCLKDRFTGNATGQTWGMQYDQKTGLLSECSLEPKEEAPSDCPF